MTNYALHTCFIYRFLGHATLNIKNTPCIHWHTIKIQNSGVVANPLTIYLIYYTYNLKINIILGLPLLWVTLMKVAPHCVAQKGRHVDYAKFGAVLKLEYDLRWKTAFSASGLSRQVSLFYIFFFVFHSVLFPRRYNWDTPVRDILGPDFCFADPQRTHSATLRDILSHSTGIPSHNVIRLRDDMNRATLAG